jgi:membrane protein
MRGKHRLRALATKATQRGVVTFELFGRNELANHAAAGAYGFLLSAAPIFLLLALIASSALRAAPDAAARLLSGLEGLGEALDVESLVESYLSQPAGGFSGIFAVLNLIWTARVFALNMQRGLRVVFAGEKVASPLKENLRTFGIEIGVIVYALLLAATSGIAVTMLTNAGVTATLPFLLPVLRLIDRLLPIAGLGLLAYAAYRHLPENRPSPRAALRGALLCAFSYTAVSVGFAALVNTTRYDLVYGALGNLVVLLANVYFFFSFFYLGAQLAYVLDSFDALVFARFRRNEQAAPSGLERRLFSSPVGLLKRYAHEYADGDTLFSGGAQDKDIFYVISGQVAIQLPGEANSQPIAVIKPGNFFGEMAFLLNETRTATARAVGATVALAFPPPLFEEIMRNDAKTARHVIDSLSQRLKSTNDHLDAISVAAPSDAPESGNVRGRRPGKSKRPRRRGGES